MKIEETRTIVFFDGVCNLCSSFVYFIIKMENNEKIHFCSLQSEYARNILGLKDSFSELNSVYFLKNNKLYHKSSAIIQILRTMNPIGNIFILFYVVPKLLRDKLYDFIARNRYLWFGKKEECMVPTKKVYHRFIVD